MRICIIGGGFSGASIALRLLPRAQQCQITIVEPRAELGLGPAYGTSYPHHLLNVPADKMGISPDAPDDFFAWARANNISNLAAAAFAPRLVYAQYLKEKFSSLSGVVRHIRSRARDIDRLESGAFLVQCDDDSRNEFDAVVLALGNQSPAVPVGLQNISGTSNFIKNPWQPDALKTLVGIDTVVVIGTGLTAVDTVLEIYERGFTGKCTMVSRRGLLPRSHPPVRFAPIPPVVSSPTSLRKLTRTLRVASRAAPWQAVVDSIRPHSATLWQGLSNKEQICFIKRVRPYWDIHRHRIPEESAHALAEMQRDGRLNVIAGHFFDGRCDGKTYSLSLRTKRGNVVVIADAVVNCAGPGPAVQDPKCDLVGTICNKGLAAVDECRLGIRVDAKLRVLAPDGQVQDGFFALGSMVQGTFWECTSVPELRQHVGLIASGIDV